jgi:hypothetical protein
MPGFQYKIQRTNTLGGQCLIYINKGADACPVCSLATI